MALHPVQLDIHYTWAGPPSALDRDINGPISLRSKVSNGFTTTYQMYFWCLDAYVDAFKRKFQLRGIKNITVRGMESFLSSCTGTAYRWYYWYGAKEDDIVARVTPIVKAAARKDATVRELVNAKNVWSSSCSTRGAATTSTRASRRTPRGSSG